MSKYHSELQTFQKYINDKLVQLNSTPGYILTYINIGGVEHPITINIPHEKFFGHRTLYSQKISIAVYFDTKMHPEIRSSCSNRIHNLGLQTFKGHDVLSIEINRHTPTNHVMMGWMSNSTTSFINKLMDVSNISSITPEQMNLVREIIDQIITIHEFEIIKVDDCFSVMERDN